MKAKLIQDADGVNGSTEQAIVDHQPVRQELIRSMPTRSTCPKCGADLPADAPVGLCPQ